MSQEKTLSKVKNQLKYPNRYDVVILNDDFTPMDFVIRLLVDIFGKNIATAKQITEEIHNSGSGVAGTYNYELAEQKTQEAVLMSRQEGHPLQFRVDRIE